MILTENKTNITSSGTFEKKAFTIKATAKAFKALSDGIYSDKITAIIRELACNAYDAHIMANKKEESFYIHLPNIMEPWFEIRDNGIGLSNEDIKTIYSTYFESTKTQSNDFIGCFGLGSKTPFCYTDNFIVESFFNGVKTSYSVYINEEGCPDIVTLNSSETSEGNGLRVRMAVKQSDFNEFICKTTDVLIPFKIKPKIEGAVINIPSINYVFSNINWGIRNEYGSARAIMGNVIYPLSDINSDILSEEQLTILNGPVDIFFDIGELETSLSRESLSYNKQTLENIKRKLDIVTQEMPIYIEQKIADAATLWDACLLIQHFITTDFSYLKNMVSNMKFNFKGTPITGYHSVSIRELMKENVVIPTQVQGVPFVMPNYNFSLDTYELSYRRSKEKIYNSYNDSSVEISDKIVFVINDNDSSHLHNRLENYLLAEKNSSTQYINGKYVAKNYKKKVYLLKFYNQEYVEKFKNFLGIEFDFVKLSDIPYIKPTRSKYTNRGYNSKYSKKLFVLDINNMANTANTASDYWKTEDIDLDNDSGVFVILESFKIQGFRADDYFSEKLDILSNISKINNINIPKIIGIKIKNKDIIDNNDNWVTFESFYNTTINSLINDNIEMFKKYKIKEFFKVGSHNNRCMQSGRITEHTLNMIKEFAKIYTNSDIDWLINTFDDTNIDNNIINVIKKQAYEYPMNDIFTKIEQQIISISEKYPLLDGINFSNYYYGNNTQKLFEHLASYLKSVDNVELTKKNSISAISAISDEIVQETTENILEASA